MGGQSSVAESVVRAVAAAEDTSPVALPPLHHSIDADALDRLFVDDAGSDPGSTVELCFHYSNSVVTVDGDGDIDATPRQPSIDSTTARQRSD